ncbi:MAG: endo-1,4-beta-xylanase [bacterium]
MKLLTSPLRCCLLLSAYTLFLVLPLSAAAPATPPFRIGLNAPFLGNDGITLNDKISLLRELGVVGLRHLAPNEVGWSDVQQSNGLFKWTNADSVFSGTNAQGFSFLPTFYGAGDGNLYVPPGTSSSVAWSASSYGNQTTTYLQTVVNRYKSNVHYWEIANEMDGKTSSPNGFTASGYAEFLNYSAAAIRAADSSAAIVIAGTVGGYGYPLSTATQWLTDVLNAGGAAGFDVLNYHDYKSWWTLPAHFDQYRAILDAHGLATTPIWVSETAQASVLSSSNYNPAYASVDGQAADTWRRPCLLFAKGAQVVFWHSLWDNNADTSGFRNMGFVSSSSGIRKKSWHSFKLLVQKIEGFTSATLLSSGDGTDSNTSGGNGVWVVRFDFSDGTRRWVAWSPDSRTATLTGISQAASVNLTTVVPTALSTDGLTPTWATSNATVTSGNLTLQLADAPVLIEVASSYSLWCQARFTSTELADNCISGATADPDADGFPNLLEYALGTDPRTATPPSSGPVISTSTRAINNQPHATLAANLSATATDLDFTVQVSSDLQTWQSGGGYTEIVSDTTSGTIRTLVVRDLAPINTSNPRRFIRLVVSTH